MNQASPVDLRQALEVANAYRTAGILFVAMPVFSDAERDARQAEANQRLGDAARQAEAEEANHE